MLSSHILHSLVDCSIACHMLSSHILHSLVLTVSCIFRYCSKQAEVTPSLQPILVGLLSPASRFQAILPHPSSTAPDTGSLPPHPMPPSTPPAPPVGPPSINPNPCSAPVRGLQSKACWPQQACSHSITGVHPENSLRFALHPSSNTSPSRLLLGYPPPSCSPVHTS